MAAPVVAQDPAFFIGTSHLLTNVTVIDGRGGPPRPESAVLIWGGKVQAVGSRGQIVVPQGTTVVDLGGSFIVPGFVDAHASPRTLEDVRAMLAGGVTAVRESALPVAVYEERGRSVPYADPAPKIFAGAPALGVELGSEEAAVAEVERQLSDGAPFITLAASLPAEWLVAVIRSARRGGAPVWADRGDTGWLLALRAGAAVVSRLISGDPELLPEAERAGYSALAPGPTRAPWLERLAPRGTEVDRAVSAILAGDAPLVPLLAAVEAPLGCVTGNERCATRPSAEDLEALRASWPAAEALVLAMRAEGIRMLVGSDAPTSTPVGSGFHREMELLVQAGIPALEVLSMATRDGAIALGQLHEFGTIEVGKRADLLVLDGDPVADIRNARKVGLVFLGGDPWRLGPDGRWEAVRFR